MSFTINRTYVLKTGKNYNPGLNGNTPVAFSGAASAGSSLIPATGLGATAAINRITEILNASGTPVVSGGPYNAGISIGVTSGTGITGTQFTLGGTASSSGTYNFLITDSDIPSYNDSPILAFHVLADPGAVTFVTLSGNTVSLPSGALAAKGVYEYAVQSITSIGVTGSLLGLAPALKPYII